jgi:hypothetical protein
MEHTAEHTHTEHHTETPEPTTVRVVVERESRHKSGSSKGANRLAQIDRRVSKAVRRVTRAVDSGVDTYIEHRDKSKASRKDGVIVDFFENVSYGMSRALAEASPVIHDVAETLNTRPYRTSVRFVARTFGSIPFIGY